MAEIDILLQGLTRDDDHDTAVNKLLQLPSIENYLFSLAFARRSGVERISYNLEKVTNKTKIFIGIRNGITSVQSIFALFKIGIRPYVVDTAANNRIFHPKIYAAYNQEDAHIILGSANLTFGGLNQNIEASSYIKLDRSVEKDREYIDKLVSLLTGLPNAYPEHVFQVTTPKQAVLLLREGRLEDERLARLPSTNKIQRDKERDRLPPIPIHTTRSKRPPKGVKRTRSKKIANKAILVWESKPLTERSLNIPRGVNTSITGDTNLGKGSMEDIDFQHYFRDVVFSELPWSTNSSSKAPHLERAQIRAEIVIKNLSFGVYNLEVTHDPRTDTRSYEQRNVMTRIKWGDARSIIAKPDLLGRTLKLYRLDAREFVIVID